MTRITRYTDGGRRRIARFFRALLDAGHIRKEAVRFTKKQFRTSRSSIYRYCAQAGISTA